MYDYIKGEIVEISPTHLTVECGSIGYRVAISIQSYSALNQESSSKIYLHHHLRDDIELLYGFYTKEERELFRNLIGVSGIGPATAQVMLSSLSTEELRVAIVSGDIDKLKSVKGIGLKTAQRIVIELKDKVAKSSTEGEISLLLSESPGKRERDEAFNALTLLGFNKNGVEKVLSSLLKENPSYTLEELIKLALKRL